MDDAEAISQLKGGDIAVLRTLIELYQAQANQIAVLITQTGRWNKISFKTHFYAATTHSAVRFVTPIPALVLAHGNQ